MAILSRPKISPQQRLDLEDWDSLLSSLRTDSLLWTKQFLSGSNLILKGFNVTGIGLKSATVAMTDATLFLPESTTDFSYFTSSPTEPDIVVPDSDLTDGVRNFLEIELCTEDNTPLTKAFWDPEANAGNGAEFNQIVNTITDIKSKIKVSTAGFSGLPDRIPLAIVDTDGSGTIKVILDRRRLFGRLATPSDLDNDFAWGTKEEPIYQLVMTGVSGTFIAGETLTIGGETATVITGGTTSITFNEPTGINYANGSAVSGGGSGASGTVNTVIESFTGVDKSLGTMKNIIDALWTEMKFIKGTRFSWQDASASIGSLVSFIDSALVQATLGALFSWDGSNLSINDSNVTPADADVLGFLRRMGKSTTISLTRQTGGFEIQKVVYSSIPDGGTLTLNQNGDVSNAINPGDDATAVQTACNAVWTNQVTVTGNEAIGFTFTFNTSGPKVAIVEGANSLVTGVTAVTTTITTVQNGYAGGSAIPIGAGQVMFIKVPATGNRTLSGVGVGDTNYQVVDRASFINSSENYWMAYNEGGVVYLRGSGELTSGESTPISDPDKETILTLINAQTARVNQDRNSKITDGGTWSTNLAGTTVTLSADAQIQLPGISVTRNTISAQTISLPNATSVAYVSIIRDEGVPVILTVNVSDNADVINTDDVVVIARRVDDGIVIGTNSFLLKPGELLELDGALAEINRLLGQLKINPHETDLDKARISTSEVIQLDSTTLNQIIGNFMLRFDGAVINFTTGVITESDGATPLGTNFTPFSIPVGEYFWYGISLLPSTLNGINEQLATVRIDQASAANAVQASAPFSTLSGTVKRGWVQVQNNSGSIERVDIKRLGVGSGSGGAGSIKATYMDPASTVLPTGATVTIDGQAGVDDDLVLYSNLVSGNNRIYKLSGVGVAIAWAVEQAFNGQADPTDGDVVRILKGDALKEQLAIFDDTNFLVNDVVRYFDGVSGDFWEQSSIKTTAIDNNTTGNIFTVNVTGSENVIVDYSVVRGTGKETGSILITSDGTSASLARVNSYLNDIGVDFSAIINTGNLELNYTSDDTVAGTMKFSVKRWSNSAGGPTGIPTYSGATGSIPAGGNIQEIQFHGGGGNIEGDSRLKFDTSDGSLNLNGLVWTTLSGGITINDNQVAPLSIINYPNASFKFAIVEYSAERNGEFRTGRMLVSNDGATATGFSDDFVETNPLGLTFSVSNGSGTVNIEYASSSTGFTGTLKFTIKKWI